MGFFINESFEHKSSGISLQNAYVNIGSFQVNWLYLEGVKKYFIHAITALFASKGKRALQNENISFEVSYDDITGNIPSLIYSWIKKNKYAGLSFLDDL